MTRPLLLLLCVIAWPAVAQPGDVVLELPQPTSAYTDISSWISYWIAQTQNLTDDPRLTPITQFPAESFVLSQPIEINADAGKKPAYLRGLSVMDSSIALRFKNDAQSKRDLDTIDRFLDGQR